MFSILKTGKRRQKRSAKTIRLFQDNRVLLRGVYDSVAERLAQKYHLRFLHLDMELVSVGDYFERGVDIITVRFRHQVTMVGLDENDKPCRLPRLVLETEEDRREWEQAEMRRQIRQKQREEGVHFYEE